MAGIGDSTLFPNSKMAAAAQLGQSRFRSGEITNVQPAGGGGGGGGSKIIDGTAGGQFSSTNTGTVTLTSTLPNDVVVLMYFQEHPSVVGTISTVTSPHLTWTKRGNYPVTLAAKPGDLEIWWAPSSAVLTGEVITITATGGVDNCAYHAFAVNGCANISSPWDTNSSLATAQATANPATSATVSGVSTNSSAPMILGCTGTNTSIAITGPAGTTKIRADQNNTGGSLYASFTSFYQTYSTAVTNASYTTTYGPGGSWTMAIDALK